MPNFEQFFSEKEKVRLDVWLWAARFFKTRSLCKQAIDGGKVEVNGNKGKASKAVTLNDEVSVSRGQERISVTILKLAEKRGPAVVASELYEETEESQKARAKEAEIRHLNQASHNPPKSRPDKKQRRQIHRFKQQH